MTFTSFEFALFFAALLVLRACVRTNNGEKWLLLVASICFYLTWNFRCVFLVVFIALFDYTIARKLAGTEDESARKRYLLFSVCTNLGVLFFFKYTNFFLENVCLLLNAIGGHVPQVRYDIILPPGVSFFTFASMAYVIDVYFERLPAWRSARDYTLFVSFFPKILSGPIVRAGELLPQFEERPRVNAEDIEIGVARFLVGAVKKLVIADQIAGHVSLIFSAPVKYDGFTLLEGVLGYAVQLYCDFSGYSDMAIGCARILGFRFPENFLMPFSSVTITEFWRRWHITMSRWFRDYVFLPLEMARRSNPRPALRASSNMLATMLLCGLWHGASWNFVIWGGIHGAALSLHSLWTMVKPRGFMEGRGSSRFAWNLASRALTLSVVLLSLVFFRAQTFPDAIVYYQLLFSWSHAGLRLVSPYILPAVAVLIATHFVVPKDWDWAERVPQTSMPVRIGAYASLLCALVMLGATDAAPFIYFQF